MKWEYVPVIGMVKMYCHHHRIYRTCKKTGDFGPTWEAADLFMTSALVTTIFLGVAGISLAILAATQHP
jgi:hypothetical protein